MNVFADDKHFISWAEPSPRCNESAKKKKCVKIAGVYIKPLLVQSVLCSIKNPVLI